MLSQDGTAGSMIEKLKDLRFERDSLKAKKTSLRNELEKRQQNHAKLISEKADHDEAALRMKNRIDELQNYSKSMDTHTARLSTRAQAQASHLKDEEEKI